jgi:hypothetical protein
MSSPVIDIQSRFVNALRTQASHKAEARAVGPLPCPYGHHGRIFQSVEQLLDHAKAEHNTELRGLDDKQGLLKVREAALIQR